MLLKNLNRAFIKHQLNFIVLIVKEPSAKWTFNPVGTGYHDSFYRNLRVSPIMTLDWRLLRVIACANQSEQPSCFSTNENSMSPYGSRSFSGAWPLCHVFPHRVRLFCWRLLQVWGKMAGYWLSSFFACLWAETQSRSRNASKNNEANIQPFSPNKLGQFRIYYMERTLFFAGHSWSSRAGKIAPSWSLV